MIVNGQPTQLITNSGELPYLAVKRWYETIYPVSSTQILSTDKLIACPQKMTKGDIALFVRHKFANYGMGYSAIVSVNGKEVATTLTEGLKHIKHGDHVILGVYQSRNWYVINTIKFQVVNDRELIAKLRNEQKTTYKSTNRDYQRTKVYHVEAVAIRNIMYERNMSYQQLTDVVNEVADMFNRTDIPKINFNNRLRTYCYYKHLTNTIELANRSGLRILLHELAHWLLRDEHVISHGKEFVYVVSLLYELYLENFTQVEFFNICDKYGVKYTTEFNFT